MFVVEQGRHPVKSYSSKEFLVVQTPIGLAKLRVPFVGNSSNLLIEWHTILFVGSLQI